MIGFTIPTIAFELESFYTIGDFFWMFSVIPVFGPPRSCFLLSHWTRPAELTGRGEAGQQGERAEPVVVV